MTTTVSPRSTGTLNPTRQQLDELDALLQRMLDLPVSKTADMEPTETENLMPEPELPVMESMPVEAAATPVSYMVVETASPRPLPVASGFEPQPSALTPRLVPVTPMPEEMPVSPRADAIPLVAEHPRNADATPLAEGAEPTPSAEEQLWVPLRSTWQPSPQTWAPLADSWHQANGSTPEPSINPPAPQLEMPMPTPTPFPDVTKPEPAEMKEEVALPDAAVIPTPSAASASASSEVKATEPRLSLSAADAPAASGLLLPLVWFNQGFDACLSPLGAPGRWLSSPGGRQLLGFVGLTCLAAATAMAILAGLGCTW